MKKILSLLICSFFILTSSAQTSYKDSMTSYLKNYVEQHQVVQGEDKKGMHFFEVNSHYRVWAEFEKKEKGDWFQMPTSSGRNKVYRVYGVLKFKINDTLVQLNIYQSQMLMEQEQYKNHLFLPFTDATTGKDSYEGGRYIDLELTDIRDNALLIDFNKAYNPYCAYVSGKYSCPVPPRENNLAVAIRAGEKAYGSH